MALWGRRTPPKTINKCHRKRLRGRCLGTLLTRNYSHNSLKQIPCACKITLAFSQCKMGKGNKSFSWYMSSPLIWNLLHTAKHPLLPPAWWLPFAYNVISQLALGELSGSILGWNSEVKGGMGLVDFRILKCWNYNVMTGFIRRIYFFGPVA